MKDPQRGVCWPTSFVHVCRPRFPSVLFIFTVSSFFFRPAHSFSLTHSGVSGNGTTGKPPMPKSRSHTHLPPLHSALYTRPLMPPVFPFSFPCVLPSFPPLCFPSFLPFVCCCSLCLLARPNYFMPWTTVFFFLPAVIPVTSPPQLPPFSSLFRPRLPSFFPSAPSFLPSHIILPSFSFRPFLYFISISYFLFLFLFPICICIYIYALPCFPLFSP